MAVKDPNSVKAETTAKQPKPKRGKADALAVHSQYEQLAKGLAQSGDYRLNALANAFVESRKASVEQFADFIEVAQTGLIDLRLIESELTQRALDRGESPDSFRIDSTGFVFDVASVDLAHAINGFPYAKAIAGI